MCKWRVNVMKRDASPEKQGLHANLSERPVDVIDPPFHRNLCYT